MAFTLTSFGIFENEQKVFGFISSYDYVKGEKVHGKICSSDRAFLASISPFLLFSEGSSSLINLLLYLVLLQQLLSLSHTKTGEKITSSGNTMKSGEERFSHGKLEMEG
ncbi:hypothetical protein AAC387_Pa09g1436 [Persea americana]